MARQSPARPVNRAVSMQRAHLARELVETLLLVGLIFVIVHFTIQSFSVGDTSMGAALQPNQTVLINKQAYLFGGPGRGDVVVLTTDPSDPNATYARRVVGLPGDTVSVGKEGGAEFAYKLDKTAQSVTVEIYDKDNKLVRTTSGDGTSGNHIVTWDGKDDAGVQVPEGQYTVKVTALDADGKKMTNTVLTYGRVASAMNDAGAVSLILGDGRTTELDDILAVTSL